MKKMSEYASGNFLKATHVKSEQEEFLVIDVEEVEANDKEVLRLTLTNGNGIEYSFDLNKTNARTLANRGFEHPETLNGKRICFRKVFVNNPTTKLEVESLRIADVK